jgi:hypothetical protein
MEAGLSDRALKVIRAALHEKTGMDLAEMPGPALVRTRYRLLNLPVSGLVDPLRQERYEIGCEPTATNSGPFRSLPPSIRPECGQEGSPVTLANRTH